MKVVINTCFGGFGLSLAAAARLAELQGKGKASFWRKEDKTLHRVSAAFVDATREDIGTYALIGIRDDVEYILATQLNDNGWWDEHVATTSPEDRADPLLVQVVQEMGKKANGTHASLAIVEIPDDVKWHIDEYDGRETVDEDHRSWG